MSQANTLASQQLSLAWLFSEPKSLLSSVLECQREVLEFVSQRLVKDARTFHELGKCQDWEDVSALQSDWIREAVADYSDETTTVIGIVTHQRAVTQRKQGLALISERTGSDKALPWGLSPYSA